MVREPKKDLAVVIEVVYNLDSTNAKKPIEWRLECQSKVASLQAVYPDY